MSPLKKIKPHNPFPVVGVGASAGGLEAFTQFLQHIPADSGMAFVLIQHLDPKQDSLLTNLLSKVTKIPIHEVKEGMKVEPNHIYVIPSEMDIAIMDGSLSLLPRKTTRGQHMPIDTFFGSLAEIQASGAIGVILSGTGADGTKGVREIHDKGGVVLVQEPASAKFDGMPRSAIATGCVNFILPPEGIAQELGRITRQPYVNGPSNGALQKESMPPSNGDTFHKILGLMHSKTGVDFSLYKDGTVNRRIQRRLLLRRIDDLSGYLTYLRENPAEIELLYNDILIKVTRFFRDPETFEVLKTKVFEEMLKGKSPDVPIRFWVPACATGEEVYSLAMCLLEFLGDQATNASIQIFGTDISDNALDKARAGVYAENIEGNVSPERLRRFFTKTDGHYQVNRSVREICVFSKQNMVKDPPFSRVDLISCRNALIYLSPVLQKRVLPTFHFALNPNGRLLLGSSETVGSVSDLFTVVDQSYRIFAKNSNVPARLNLDFSPVLYPGDEPRGPRPPLSGGPDITSNRANVQNEINRTLLNRYVPVGVVVNDNLDILHFRGDTSPYLIHPTGEVTFKLMRMVREGLQTELGAAIKAAKKNNLPFRNNRLSVDLNGEIKDIRLEVIPIKIPLSGEQYWGVMFSELLPRKSEKKPAKTKGRKAAKKAKAGETDGHHWKQEMASTKAYLEAVIAEKDAAFEGLQSANEEVLSSNEELQSINEEMQTAKEELQSTNEEIVTVNDELRHSSMESIKLVNDLNNFVESVNIPILMVNNDLTIRRFTPEAGRVLHLLPSDVGRALRDLNFPINLDDLEKLILDSIGTVSVKEQQIGSGENLWYSVRIRPYQTQDKKVEGAVITLIDIETMKRAEEIMVKARDAAKDALDTVREPLVVLDSTLRVIQASSSFYQTFKVSPKETENSYFFDLGNGQWNLPDLQSRLEDVALKNIPFYDLPIDQNFQTIGRRFMMLNASKIISKEKGEPLILLAIADITDKKKIEEELARKAVEVARSNQDLQDFAHIVSHDLQSPLHKIIAFGDLLKINIESPVKVLDYLTRIQRGATKMSEIIRSLVAVSSATSFKKTEVVDMAAVAREVLTDLEGQIREAGAKVTMDNLPTIHGDKTQIGQLMTNLITNAIKYRGKEMLVIHISAKKEGQCWICSVRDNGIGIEKENAKRIFDLFQRIIAEGTPVSGGSGIGLTICKKIVESHGGKIWVESALGQGSTFYFTLSA